MIMGQTLVEIFKNSLVMIILLVASIAALALVIERFWYFTRNRFTRPRDWSRCVASSASPARPRLSTGHAGRRTLSGGCSRWRLRTWL